MGQQKKSVWNPFGIRLNSASSNCCDSDDKQLYTIWMPIWRDAWRTLGEKMEKNFSLMFLAPHPTKSLFFLGMESANQLVAIDLSQPNPDNLINQLPVSEQLLSGFPCKNICFIGEQGDHLLAFSQSVNGKYRIVTPDFQVLSEGDKESENNLDPDFHKLLKMGSDPLQQNRRNWRVGPHYVEGWNGFLQVFSIFTGKQTFIMRSSLELFDCVGEFLAGPNQRFCLVSLQNEKRIWNEVFDLQTGQGYPLHLRRFTKPDSNETIPCGAVSGNGQVVVIRTTATVLSLFNVLTSELITSVDLHSAIKMVSCIPSIHENENDDLLVIFNENDKRILFKLPSVSGDDTWEWTSVSSPPSGSNHLKLLRHSTFLPIPSDENVASASLIKALTSSQDDDHSSIKDNIQILDLSKNYLCAKDLEFLTKNYWSDLNLASLNSLDLSFNSLGDDCLGSLFLKQLPALTHFKFAQNSMTLTGLESLFTAVNSQFPALESLILSSNPFGLAGAQAVVKFLESKNPALQTLKEIDLANCCLTAVGVFKIMEATHNKENGAAQQIVLNLQENGVAYHLIDYAKNVLKNLVTELIVQYEAASYRVLETPTSSWESAETIHFPLPKMLSFQDKKSRYSEEWGVFLLSSCAQAPNLTTIEIRDFWNDDYLLLFRSGLLSSFLFPLSSLLF